MSTEFTIIKDKLELSEQSALGSIQVYIPIEELKKNVKYFTEGWDEQGMPFTIARDLTLTDLRALRDRIDYIISCDTLLD